MKDIRTTLEVIEKITNDSKITYELVRLDKIYSSGKIARGYTEYVLYETIGEHTSIKLNYKRESKIRQAMNDLDI